MAPATSVHNLKLFIDTNARRVMFAEASKDAVDFLHSLLVSHLGSLRFDDATGHGCIVNIYDSADALAAHANAAAARTCTCSRCSLAPLPGARAEERFFVCSDMRRAGCGGFVTTKSDATCLSCGARMAGEVPRGAPDAGGSSGGRQQQQGAAALMMCLLKDDLTVDPAPGPFLEVISAAFRAATAFQVQVATAQLGHKEGLEILEASLRSSTVLTDVFLRDKAVALEFHRTSRSLGLGIRIADA
ncbi:unnamed protein product [Urochloa humidicola]